MQNQEAYPSDVNDCEWELLSPLVTVPSKLGRPPRHDRRLVLNAIFYVVRSGCAWRLLPHDLPPWRLCYYYFAKWRENGLWQEINDHLREAVREKNHAKKKTPVLRSSTRRVLKWLTTPECAATMQARRLEGENGIWW
jgi:transposase